MRCHHRLGALVLGLIGLNANPSFAQQPVIHSAVPSTSGQLLTIRGLDFGDAPAVYLNNQLVLIQSATTSQVIVLLPPLAAGTYSLALVHNNRAAFSDVALGGVGTLAAPPTGTATSVQGYPSAPISQSASTFNMTTQGVERQTFRWVAEPVGNNTPDPTAQLSLRFGVNGATPQPTGFGLNANGTVTFAPFQVFPGVVTDVSAGAGLVRSGSPASATLSVGANAITGGMIADGTIGYADLAFSPATQSSLNWHISNGHDTLYYTKAESDGRFQTKRTRLWMNSDDSHTNVTGNYKWMHGFGNFTKERANSSILLLWNGTVMTQHFPFANNFCEYQLRIDDDYDGPFYGGGKVISRSNDYTPVGASALFTGLAAGQHSVSIWVRGNAAACWLNPASLTETVIVEESGS